MVWAIINDRWMNALTEILEIDWDPLSSAFTSYVSFSPVCPRNLKDFSFAIPHFLPKREVIRVSAHEITHFLYFRKIKFIDHQIQEKEYNYPYSAWLLSEILAPIILNDPRSTQILGESEITSYVCNRSLSMHFKEMYKYRLDKELSFEEFYHFISKIELRVEDITPNFRDVLSPS